MTVDEADVERWRSWIGRTETRSEILAEEPLRRFAAAIGEELDVARVQPSLGHWAFFLPTCAGAELGSDGHPRRGGFIPPIILPRRMFAAAEMSFPAPLVLGQVATMTAAIVDIAHKRGRSGDLVFVDVERTVSQMGKARVCERQTIVYRDAGEATPAVQAIRTDAGEDGEMWRPESTDLFRFSAATFNTHRIHYDEPYAREVEGHPALVVQGPFIAAKLAGFARRQAGQALAQFSFRAHAPAMVNQPIRIGMGRTGGEVAATRCDGVIAMTGAFSTEGA